MSASILLLDVIFVISMRDGHLMNVWYEDSVMVDDKNDEGRDDRGLRYGRAKEASASP